MMEICKSGMNEILMFCEKTFGSVSPHALVEIIPNDPKIAVHCVPAEKGRDFITLFTTGMSACAMSVPEGAESCRFAEIFIQLPADWKFRNVDDPEHGWPAQWLRTAATFLHRHKTWIGYPYAIMENENPPEPLAANVPFTALLLLSEYSFERSDGETVQLFRMFPLFPDEVQLEIDHGGPALMNALDAAEIGLVYDSNRKSAAVGME